jgi:hypothetical protein
MAATTIQIQYPDYSSHRVDGIYHLDMGGIHYSVCGMMIRFIQCDLLFQLVGPALCGVR